MPNKQENLKKKSRNKINNRFTRSVAYTASINPKMVQPIPTAGPFTTAISGFGKSMKELTKLLNRKVILYTRECKEVFHTM